MIKPNATIHIFRPEDATGKKKMSRWSYLIETQYGNIKDTVANYHTFISIDLAELAAKIHCEQAWYHVSEIIYGQTPTEARMAVA